MLSGTSAFASDDGIVFPRLNYQRGPIVSTLAEEQGRLMLRGRCLLLEMSEILEEYLVPILITRQL